MPRSATLSDDPRVVPDWRVRLYLDGLGRILYGVVEQVHHDALQLFAVAPDHHRRDFRRTSSKAIAFSSR